MRYTKILPTLTLLVLLAYSAVLADNGYRLDYDYPDQGDDWYGSSAGPDSRRDYPVFDLDQSWNGNDYGAGYDRLTDPFGYGPSLDLFVDRYSAYDFRFGNQEFYGWDCHEDGHCGGGSWCSFQGDCIAGRCDGGGPRSCSDGNDCTQDVCTDGTGACSNPHETDGTSCNTTLCINNEQ